MARKIKLPTKRQIESANKKMDKLLEAQHALIVECQKAAVLNQAIKWWKKQKPTGWRLKRHLENPFINLPKNEHPLAMAVSEYLKTVKK